MNKIAGNRHRAIRKQIQSAIIAISVISMLVLGVCFYMISTRNIEKNYRDDFSYNLKISDNIMELQFDYIIESMRSLLTNQVYMGTLLSVDSAGETYFDTAQTRILEAAASEIMLQSTMVQEVLSVSGDGRLNVHSKKEDVSQYISLHRDKGIVDADWAVQARAYKGHEMIVGSNVLTGAEDVVSIVKCMIEPSSGELAGYMIINVNKKIFDKAFDNRGNYETNCFMLLDTAQGNECVYYQGDAQSRQAVYDEYTRTESSLYYIFCERDSSIQDGWVLISGISGGELNKQRKEMGTLIASLIVVLIVVGILVSVSISNRIYKPLGKLEHTIQQVEEGNRNITEEFDDSEIGLLGDKFKKMVNNNLVLRERLLYARIRQREQELHLLQEQINPHFLYNTLDALYCLAEIHGVDDIARMVEALSETFRFSLNKGNRLICVKDELAHIKAYMTIQNMRFQDRFEMTIDADEVMDVKIMKLILEPFVENAIVHGLEPKIGPGKVRVVGERLAQGDILFTVTDDGVGVDDMTKLEQGYGISNVKERLALYYGAGYGVTFESREGAGTTVYIKISETGMGMLKQDEKIDNRG